MSRKTPGGKNTREKLKSEKRHTSAQYQNDRNSKTGH